MPAPLPQVSIAQAKEANQDLAAVERARAAGDLGQAQSLCESLLERHPDYAGAHSKLAMVHMQGGAHAAALPHLVKATMHNPNDWVSLTNLGKVYLELGAPECAEGCLERALALNSGQAVTLHVLGETKMALAETADAAALFEKALDRDPRFAVAAIVLGLACIKLERYGRAARALASALGMALSPDERAMVCFYLSELPEIPEDIDIFEEIRSAESAALNRSTRTPMLLAYARAGVLRKQGRHEDAWRCWEEINSQIANDTKTQRQTYLAQAETLLEKAAGWRAARGSGASKGNDAPVSLFILGASRSGKTTLESLLAPLDGVSAGLERGIAKNTANRVSQRARLLTEDFLADLPDELNSSIAEFYHSELRRVAGDAKVFTITHPGAINDVGRLAGCVPNARFVFLKRDARDNAFRIFSNLYQPNSNHYAYDIKDVRDYLDVHDRLIGNWLKKLGKKALLISYDEMVADPDATLRKVAKLCGLKVPAKLKIEIGDDRGCAEPYRAWLDAAS